MKLDFLTILHFDKDLATKIIPPAIMITNKMKRYILSVPKLKASNNPIKDMPKPDTPHTMLLSSLFFLIFFLVFILPSFVINRIKRFSFITLSFSIQYNEYLKTPLFLS